MTNATNGVSRRVIAGPSELQILMSLMRPSEGAPFRINMTKGTAVKFTVMREDQPNVEIWTAIESIQREDGSGNSWNIGGQVLDGGEYRTFNGYYNSKLRVGHIKF